MYSKIRYILLFLLLLSTTRYSYGQCSFNDTLAVPDQATEQIFLNINGAMNNDLSTNGVCGVKLKFKHSNLGDFIIELISPAGEIVPLVGPAGIFGSTAFTLWDVTFVPCAMSAQPDVGFSAQWSNDQFWGSFGNYTGSYYPYSGCLEDLDTGPVNGVWTVRIKDNFQFGTGEILEVQLIFCDPTGIDCAQCDPPTLKMKEKNITACIGSELLALKPKLKINYNDSTEIGLYSSFYAVAKQDTIIEMVDSVDMRAFPSGTYTICGLIALNEDLNRFKNYIDTMPIPEIKADLNGESPEFCADITQRCMVVKIKEPPDTIELSHNICRGDTFYFRGEAFAEAGLYHRTFQAVDNCDTTYALRITETYVKSRIKNAGDITCYEPTIRLDASNSVIPPQSTIKWFTQDGHIIGSKNEVVIEVDEPGTYSFVIHKLNCSDTASIQVKENIAKPDVTVSNDTITCFQRQLRLPAFTNDAYDSLKWKGPGGFSSRILRPSVNQAGDYTLRMTGSNGCVDSFSLHISVDTIAPEVHAIEPDSIACEAELIKLDIKEAYRQDYSYRWASTAGFIALVKDTFAEAKIATYTIEVMDKNNGCKGTDAFRIDTLIALPDVLLEVKDTLDCYTAAVRIFNSTTPDTIGFQWTGPAGFSSTERSPYVSVPGTYYLSTVTVSGCDVVDSISVEGNYSVPDVSLIMDTLHCHEDTVYLKATSSYNVIFEWHGPAGYHYTGPVAPASIPGVYTVTATTSGGCSNEASDTLKADFDRSGIALFSDTLTCADSIAEVYFMSGKVNSFYWITSDTMIVYDSLFTTKTAGYQYFYYVDSNGCNSIKYILTDTNYVEPTVRYKPLKLDCNDDSVQFSLIMSDAIQYSWKGPMGYTSTEEEPWVKHAGNYYLKAKGINGCFLYDTITVPYDTIPMDITMLGEDFNCTRDSVRLGIKEHKPILEYQWEGPGNYTSTEAHPYIGRTGTYFVTITAGNACKSYGSIEIDYDTIAPQASIIGDTLECNKPTITLYASANAQATKFSWYFDGSLMDTGDSLITGQEGEYMLIAEAPNTCTDTLYYTLHSRVQLPDFSVDIDTLTCEITEIRPSVEIDTSKLLNFSWTGPSGFSSDSLEPIFNAPGDYEFTFTTLSGCVGGDVYTVVEDVSTPPLKLKDHYHLNCSNLTIELDSILPASEYSMMWIFNGDTIRNQTSFLISEPGNLEFAAQGWNGCAFQKKMTVTIDTTSPTVHIEVDTITCRQTKVRAEITAGSDSYTYSWRGPHNYISTDKIPTFIDPGVYTLEVIDTNGCMLSEIFSVYGDTLAPVINLQDGSLSCDDGTCQLRLGSASPIETVRWFGPGNFFSTERRPLVDVVGDYHVTVIAPNGCFSKDTLHVDNNPEYPSIQVQAYSIDCYADTVKVRVVPETGDDYVYEWKLNNELISRSISPILDGNEIYTLTVIDTFNGCFIDTLIEFNKDTLLPVVDIIQENFILCEKDTASLTVKDELIQDYYTFQWSAVGSGRLVSNETFPRVWVKGKGIYKLVLTDTRNGCSYADTITIDSLHSSLRTLKLRIEPLTCFQRNDGRVEILEVVGGEAPYKFAFNNAFFSKNKIYTDLGLGEYTLTVSDRYGCILDTLIVLDDIHLPRVELAGDTIIDAGTILQLTPKINVDTLGLEMHWMPTTSIHCPTCAYTSAQPIHTTTYTFSVEDTAGCRASDSREIVVRKAAKIYVPTAFSPNGDKLNDYVRPFFGNNIAQVDAFEIYDRWGNLMFSVHNVPRGTFEKLAWDGTAYGKPLSPQVFTYKLIFTLKDGRGFEKAGTITLLK